jgi:hypothetical protein
MRIILAAAAALLPLVPGQALAQQWYNVGGNDKTQSYVDASSLRASGDKIIGDVMSIYATPLNDGEIRGAKIKTEFACRQNYFRTIEYSYYGDDGMSFRTEPSETLDEHKVPKPDSINEAIMAFACYKKGGTAVTNPFVDAPTRY